MPFLAIRRFFNIVALATSWPSIAHAQLVVGHVIQIAGQEYQISGYLGEGSLKKVFRAYRVDCTVNCEIAIGDNYSPETYFDLQDYELVDQVVNSDSPHLRREYSMVKVQLPNLPGETYMSVMELGQSTLFDTQYSLKVKAKRLLLQDAYNGVAVLESKGIVNADIKPQNMLLMGEIPNEMSIVQEKSFLAIADHDVLYKKDTPVQLNKYRQPMFTPKYSPPEYFTDNPTMSNRGSIWQLSASFYEMMTGRDAFEVRDLLQFSKFQYAKLTNDKLKLDSIQYTWKNSMSRIQEQLDLNVRRAEVGNVQSEIDAAKEMRELILNGFKLDPMERELRPQVVIDHPRIIKARTDRLRIDSQFLVRRREDVNVEKIGQLRSGLKGESCDPKSIFAKVNEALYKANN